MLYESIHSFETISFLSIQLLRQLSKPIHLTYSLSPFILITFSILNSSWLAFCSSFSQNVQTISSPLRSLIIYVHGTVSFDFLIIKTSSDQLRVYL